jgi:hypothetical protein
MARLAELRKTAKGMGIPKAVILRATTASALEKIIADHESHDGKPKKKGAVKKAVKKATGKVAKKKTTEKPNRKNSARKASAPAKSKGATKAKRQSNSNGNGGRNTLDGVDFSLTEGWNPRDGSAPDRIIKALKRFKGNRAKAFDHLKGDVWDFVAKKTASGEKRSKADAEEKLRWRISRTAWDFAMRTGQHEASSNRVEYGTGGTGTGAFKRKKTGGRQSASKAPARKAAQKSTRKPAKAQKGAQKRGGARKRGRAKAGSRR